MKDDLNQRLIESAERWIDYQDKLIEIFHRADNDSTSRITWLVAISGFAIINIPLVISYTAAKIPIFYILLPWLVTATIGIVTHWQFRNRRNSELLNYITKRGLLMAYLTNGVEFATIADLNDIIENKKEPLSKYFKEQLSTTRLTDFLELAIMLCFVASIAITIHVLLP